MIPTPQRPREFFSSTYRTYLEYPCTVRYVGTSCLHPACPLVVLHGTLRLQ